MHSDDYALIITGCIFPKSSVFSLKLTDASERLIQYLDSIRFYINETGAKNIVFCENSNYEYDYSELICEAKRKGKKLEVLKYIGDSEKIAEQGKGYGEGEILEYALKHSELLPSIKYIYKVTGRIVIKNFDAIVELEDIESIYFNKNLYSFNSLDTRFWGMPGELFEDLFLEQYYKVHDNELRFLEHVYYETLENTILKYRQHAEFPLLVGKSGSTGTAYKENKPIYTKWFSFIANKGVFNNQGVYFTSYVFLHWEKCWRELLAWIKSRIYHYYAGGRARLLRGFVLARTVIYHYYAEGRVRLMRGLVLARTVIYHYYAEGKVRLYRFYAESRDIIKGVINQNGDK